MGIYPRLLRGGSLQMPHHINLFFSKLQTWHLLDRYIEVSQEVGLRLQGIVSQNVLPSQFKLFLSILLSGAPSTNEKIFWNML